MSPQTETAVNTQEVEALVSSFQKDQEKVRQAASEYKNSMVSSSISVGPDGAGMQGWITHTQSGVKIHFVLSGEATTAYGLFAGGGGLALVGALASERLDGQTGRFKASGQGGGGAIELFLSNGQPVLTQPIPVVGAGIPFANWRVEGKVKFTLAA